MTEQLYFTIGFGFFLWFNFGTLKYIFLCLVAYVFDEDVRKISDKDFSFPFSVAVKGDRYLGSADFFGIFVISFVFSLLWPLFAVIFLVFVFVRTLRFFVRMTKGLKKLSSVAHSHKDDKVVVEEIGEIKF
jgi:hypothetical protein